MHARPHMSSFGTVNFRKYLLFLNEFHQTRKCFAQAQGTRIAHIFIAKLYQLIGQSSDVTYKFSQAWIQ